MRAGCTLVIASSGFAVTAGALLVPSVAHAAPPKPLAQTLTGEAKADYDAGKTLFAEGSNAAALAKFESAYAKSKDVRLLWNAAVAARGANQFAHVMELLRTYLREGEGTLSAVDKADAEEMLKGIEPLVSRVLLAVNQAGAEVTIDDRALGTTPLVRAAVLDVGTHHVVVKKAGFQPFDRNVKVVDREMTLDVVLLAEVTVANLEVLAAPAGAMVYIDGVLKGKDNVAGSLPAGPHALRVALPDYLDHRVDLTLKGGESRTLNITLEKQKGGIPAWVWITGGIVLAGGAAAGVYFATRSDPERALPPPGTFGGGYAFAARGF